MRQALAVVIFLVTALAAQTAQVKSRGLITAPIVLEVYSDYECPHCKMLYERTLTPLIDDYVSGKVDETVCSILTPAEAKKVRALAKDPAIMAEVQQDVQAGHLAHIDSTPSVFITHKATRLPIPGNVSYQILRRYIDQLLSSN
jgi:protein-disulfide isomerase